MVGRLRFSLLTGLFLISLFGCGGGGDGSSTAANSPEGDNPTYSVTLSWETPTSETDGTPMANLAGYNIYYGKSPHSYTNIIDMGNVKTYTLGNLLAGTYYIAVTAYDSSGNETDFSNEVRKIVP